MRQEVIVLRKNKRQHTHTHTKSREGVNGDGEKVGGRQLVKKGPPEDVC